MSVERQLMMASGGVVSYQIANSLRFRSSASAYLSRTPSVAGNQQTWTWSGWVKPGSFGANLGVLFGADSSSSVSGLLYFYANNLYFDNVPAGTPNARLTTTQVFRDYSAWYHIVAVWDTTNATSGDRLRLYVNGSRVTAFVTATYPAQNTTSIVNTTVLHEHGRYGFYGPGASNSLFDGYMADINFIDGQALTPTSFGAFDTTTGVWTPKSYAGTYGTNGFHLNFSNGTSTTTLGYDSSGNSNNWTTNNISLTAGSTYDWMLDSPTPFAGTSYGVGNYAVLNPLQTGSYVTESNANLTLTGNTATDSAIDLASISNLTSGKWYWEYTQGTVSSETCGAMLQAMNGISLLNAEGVTASYGIGARANGNVYGASKTVANITSWTTGDVIGIAVDVDNGAIYWSKNGTWLNSGVPTSGSSKTGAVGAWTPSASVVVTPSFGAYNGGSVSATFGQRPFAYTPPTGYKTLCNYNLPASTILNGAKYMAATLYTGTGATLAVSNAVNGVGFQPDFIWIKSRSAAYDHRLQNSVVGFQGLLDSNSTAAEYTASSGDYPTVSSSGFSLPYGTNGLYYNGSGVTFVGWQWKAGGTAVTNTAGSITSQVSANTTAGFSVVTYTGTGSAATVGHGLGASPAMMIIKRRNSAVNWFVFFPALNYYFEGLNTTSAGSTPTTGSMTVNSSTISITNTGDFCASGGTYVWYCWAAIPGFSAFGSYTGNGSSDGPFVYCGFRPRYVLIKRTDASGNDWVINDTSRPGYNVANNALFANLSDSELTSGNYQFDIVSNGFKIRGTTTGDNASGGTYIYAAFAECPINLSLAR